MKILIIAVGKTHENYIKEGTDMFTKRIGNYYPIHWHIIPAPKNAGMLNDTELKIKESDAILAQLKTEDYLVLLDERGKQMKSEALADFVQKRANESVKQIVFLIGGAFGVNETITQRANWKWSLSQLVFPHQLVRLILTEQIYRACTIIRNEKYHHK